MTYRAFRLKVEFAPRALQRKDDLFRIAAIHRNKGGVTFRFCAKLDGTADLRVL
jgi:hypothetical protein